MKKLSLFALLLIAGVLLAHSQTQRMVLYEGFSNASCPPCASQNPTTNALIAANPTKVVALKYQTNWPGVDPMNAQTQTWVGPRVSYYGISGVPATRVDGTGTSINQTVIDTRYAVPSPFFLTVDHTLNSAGDSAFVEVIVTAAQDYTGTSLVLQVGMVEKHIGFTSAPGTNGEKDFYHVMRRMYPGATGTSLQSAWLNTEADTFHFAVAIPTYLYDINQMAFVAFIQSNSDKSVLQAANNDPAAFFDLYPRITSHNIPSEPTCTDSLDLTITVKNTGTIAFTSFDVEYGAQGETLQTINWSGNLAPNQSTVIDLPVFSFTSTNPLIYIEVKNPNGSANYPSLHAKVLQSLNIISSYNPIPLEQGFTSTTFPPTNWISISDDDIKWARATVGGFGNTPAGSATMKFYLSPAGKIDYLYFEPLDLTGTPNLILTFSVAHARYNASYGNGDRLQVEISINCGASWTSIYSKQGTTLATAPDFGTGQFTPTAAQWRSDTVDLASYMSNDEVLIRLKATSGYGNNLYVDDINIGQNFTGYGDNDLLSYFNVFPNPVDDVLHFEFSINKQTNVRINIIDMTGKLITSVSPSELSQGMHSVTIDVASWAAGLYHAVIVTDNNVVSSKIIKN